MTLLGAIPVPNDQSVRLLLEGLQRLARLGWVREAERAGLWPCTDWLAAAIGTLPTNSFTADDPSLALIKNQYDVYSALVDARLHPPKWLESTRAILVLAAWSWRGRQVAAQGAVASAIRAFQFKGKEGSPLGVELARLGNAQSLLDLIDIAAGLNLADKEMARTFWDAWSRHVVPLLRESRRPVAVPVARPPGVDGPPSPPGGLSGPRTTGGKSNATKKSRGPRKFRLTTRPEVVPHELRAEAPQDLVAEVLTFDVPGVQNASRDQQRVELLRANQAIWTQNSLLLPDHYDSLGWVESKLLGAYLAEQVENGPAEIAQQFARLAISLATGRTTKTLAMGSVGDDEVSACSKAWVLNRDKSELVSLVPHPEDAYKPDPVERVGLITVGDVLVLRLPKGLESILCNARDRGLNLIGCAEEMDRDIKAACAVASEALGFPITSGKVRRTLSRLLQDAGRDVAKTMLITGDTFGWSLAPLYYTSPRISDLQELYLGVAASMFGGTVAAIPPSEDRVGAKLLRTVEARSEPAADLKERLTAALALGPGLERARLVHARMVDYVAFMLLEVGHRPVNALFRLPLGSFDLRGLGAVFQDKGISEAMTSRFVAIPKVMAAQLMSYLQHLSALAEHLDRAGKNHVRKVLAGNAPLLFGMGARGEVMPLTFSTWYAQLPNTCVRLPPNAGRTTIATRGREIGADPEALLAHLGHQEACGFPFSISSPTIPLLLAQELALVLDRIASEAGWRCQDGLGGRVTKYIPCDTVIRDWTSSLKAHEQGQQEALRAARDALRAKGRSAKEVADSLVSRAILDAAPALHAAIHAGTTSEGIEQLDQDEVGDLQGVLLEQADGDPVLAYAAMHALRTKLNFARTKCKWGGFVPFRWKVARRNEGTPFFPGMMTARDQIESLRDEYEKIGSKVPEGVDPTAWAFGRTALALMLFGFVDDAEELRGLLASRNRLRRIANLEEVLLVQWRESPYRVSGLPGLAAIALGALAWHFPKESVPDDAELEKAMIRMMPRGWSVDRSGLLRSLLSTVSVANRIELSGAARTAAHPELGGRNSSVEQQVAWLDNDPPNPRPCGQPVGGALKAQVTPRTPSSHTPPLGSRSAQKQYERLLAIFPSSTKGSVLPLTNQTVSAVDIGRCKPRLIAELEATVSHPGSREIIVALAHWAIHMLEEGTEGTDDPVPATVEKYLSTVGSELVPLVGDLRLTKMAEENLAATLLDIVEMKTTAKTKNVAARETRNFYRIAAMALGLPEVDLDELSLYLPTGAEGVDVELIRPSEVDDSLSSLDMEARDIEKFTSEELRHRRQAHWALSLFRQTGARSGEVLGSRLRDLHFAGADTLFRVVRNRNRRLKTPAGRRRYVLTHRLSEAARDQLCEWHVAEYQRLPRWTRASAYSISAMDSARDLAVRQVVRDLIADSLASSTGRASERPHRLRHLVAAEALTWTFLSPVQRERLGFLRPLSDTPNQERTVLFPRDLARHTILLGHADPLTTIRVYMHFPWLLRLQSAAWLTRKAKRQGAAVALGITPAGADRITQRSRSKLTAIAWLDHVVKPRIKPEPAFGRTETEDVDPLVAMGRLTTADLMRIIEWTERGALMTSAGLSAGCSPVQVALISAAADEYRAQTGVKFLDAVDQTERHRPVVRRNSVNKHLQGLMRLLEPGDEVQAKSRAQLVAVANAMFVRAKVRHRDAIVLPAPESAILRRLLIEVGHDDALVETSAVEGSPLQSTRVRRRLDSKVYAGLEVKRLLGIVWVGERARELARFQS